MRIWSKRRLSGKVGHIGIVVHAMYSLTAIKAEAKSWNKTVEDALSSLKSTMWQAMSLDLKHIKRQMLRSQMYWMLWFTQRDATESAHHHLLALFNSVLGWNELSNANPISQRSPRRSLLPRHHPPHPPCRPWGFLRQRTPPRCRTRNPHPQAPVRHL